MYYTLKKSVFLYFSSYMIIIARISFFVEMTNIPNNVNSIAKYFNTLKLFISRKSNIFCNNKNNSLNIINIILCF